MDLLRHYLLTVLIFLPTAGALFLLPARTQRATRWIALSVTLLTFLVSLLVLVLYDWHSGTGYAYADEGGVVQMVLRADWIKPLNIQYLVGIDGLGLPLVLLTTFISVLACIASWNIDRMTKGYMFLLLLLETGILGTFLSLDFFLFYVFFEISLLPMYFLIGIWGGPRKEYAAIKFFLYTLLGSIALLIVLIATYLYSKQIVPGGTFDLVRLAGHDYQSHLATVIGPLGGKIAKTLFVLLMIGFLVKLPAIPPHTWLPDAHVEAPTPISMILASLLLKMGGYGILRIAYPLFPEAGKALWMVFAIVGVVSIIYGALCAMAQTDFKRLVAYSSISHMGFVTLGAAMMTEASINGAMFMMVAHGITSAALFFIVGVVYDRAHHRELRRLGGLATTMPIYTGFSAVAMFANLGLPGLCGFVGEILVLLGSFQAARPGSALYEYAHLNGHLHGFIIAVRILSVIACFGIVLTAAYMLWTIQRVFFGLGRPEYGDFTDVDQREVLVLVPLTAMAILLGVLPTVLFFMFTDTTVAGFMSLLKPILPV